MPGPTGPTGTQGATGPLGGPTGPTGPQGPTGSGAGLSSGGLTGQVLTKNSATNFDTIWQGPVVQIAGSTLTGPLVLAADPTVALGAATKQYVDARTPTTTLTGDVTGSGSGTVPTTLATVNPNVGTFQGITVNAKGLVTGAVNQGYAPLASPAFTGTPTLPTGTTGVTQTAGTNNTSLATTAFVATAVAGGPFLPIAGGTLTGTVAMAATNPQFILNKAASGQAAYLIGQTNGLARWQIQLGSGAAESSGNVGSDFLIQRFNDAGTSIDFPLSITRSTGLVTLAQNLTVNGNAIALNAPAGTAGQINIVSPSGQNSTLFLTVTGAKQWYLSAGSGGGLNLVDVTDSNLLALQFTNTVATFGVGTISVNAAATAHALLYLRKGASGYSNIIYGSTGSTGTTTRWGMSLGDSTAESGSNAGSNFNLQRFDDTATLIDSPITIPRSTGIVNFNLTPTHPTPTAGDNSTKSATTAFVASLAGAYVPLAGGTMTGTLSIIGAPQALLILKTTNVNTELRLDKPASGNTAFISGNTAGSVRWRMFFGGTQAESGSNVGSDFSIQSFADDGTTVIGNPFYITRSNSAISIIGPIFQNNAAGTVRGWYAQTAGSMRWCLQVANGGAESGSNTGSDFQLNRYTDAGVLVEAVFTINRASGLATFAQQLNVNGGALTLTAPASAHTALTLNHTTISGYCNYIYGRANGSLRWLIAHGDQSGESTGNAGSNWYLARYNDAGAVIDQPISIVRSTGVVTFSQIPVGVTPATTDNSTNLATTAFVKAAMPATGPAYSLVGSTPPNAASPPNPAPPMGLLFLDTSVPDATQSYLPLSGGTLTGPLLVQPPSGNPNITVISPTTGNQASLNVTVGGGQSWGLIAATSSSFLIYDNTSNNTRLQIGTNGIVQMPAGATAPTPAATDNSTNVATTAFVQSQVFGIDDVGRNKIHNAMFRIQQRGTGPWTANTSYTADRWQMIVNLDTHTVTVVNPTGQPVGAIGGGFDEELRNYLNCNVAGNAGAGSYSGIQQKIEGVARLSNKTVTFSFYCGLNTGTAKIGVEIDQIFGSGGSPSAAVISPTQVVTVSATWARYSLTFTLPSVIGKTLGTNNDDCTMVRLWLSSQANASIGVQTVVFGFWGMQLEVGTSATQLEKLDIALDSMQCERFYQNGSFDYQGYALAANGLYMSYNFPTRMRSTPSMTTSGGGISNATGQAISGWAPTTFDISFTVTAAGMARWYGSWIATADL